MTRNIAIVNKLLCYESLCPNQHVKTRDKEHAETRLFFGRHAQVQLAFRACFLGRHSRQS